MVTDGIDNLHIHIDDFCDTVNGKSFVGKVFLLKNMQI
jgi:hypothetical protein